MRFLSFISAGIRVVFCYYISVLIFILRVNFDHIKLTQNVPQKIFFAFLVNWLVGQFYNRYVMWHSMNVSRHLLVNADIWKFKGFQKISSLKYAHIKFRHNPLWKLAVNIMPWFSKIEKNSQIFHFLPKLCSVFNWHFNFNENENIKYFDVNI